MTVPEFTYDPWTAVDLRSWMDPTGTAERPGAQDEPLGSKEKFWLTDPSGVSWLFKYARTGGVDNWVSGEDWAEVAVAELAVLIGVPTASVRLGLLDDCRGCSVEKPGAEGMQTRARQRIAVRHRSAVLGWEVGRKRTLHSYG